MAGKKMLEGYALADFIKTVKKELMAAYDAGKDYPLFSIEEATIEVSVSVGSGTHAGLRIIPLSASISDKFTQANKLSVKLRLLSPNEKKKLRTQDQEEHLFAAGNIKRTRRKQSK